MGVNDKIKERRLELKLSLKDVANALGVAESTVSRYETKDIQNMGIDKIEALAKVLECSPGYLMGWEDNKATELSPKAEKDIKKALGETLEQLENSQDALMFDGEQIDDETRELLRSSLENSMRIAKKIAKEKYTPKKYKK